MTSRIIAIQGNHPSKLNLKSDTSIFLAVEAQNRKYKIFYYEPEHLSIINNRVIARGYYVEFSYSKKKFFKINKKLKLDLSQCKYLLVRQDPPFNLEYISTTYILDKIKDKVKIINNPTSIRNISEKLYSTSFQKFMPNTIFTKDINEINKFFIKNKKIIIKPIHSFSGNDIHLIETKINKKVILIFIKKHGHIMCQKFLPKIKFGDKRVFLINGKICGAISRIPKKGSFLSNMSKGATPIATKLTKVEILISFFVSLIAIGIAPLLILLKKDPFLGTLEIAPQIFPLIKKTLLSPNLIFGKNF